jgi:hypothetical protein
MNTKTLTRDEETSSILLSEKFRNVMIVILAFTAIMFTAYSLYTSPKTITIDEKHWECTDTEPAGIGAQCTNLRMKKFSLRAQ